MINPKDVADRVFRELSPLPEMCVEWTVPGDLSYFDGHFPGRPTLPAVAMIDLTLEILRTVPGYATAELANLKSAKFTAVVEPGTEVTIRLTHDVSVPSDAKWRSEWKLKSGSGDDVLAASFLFAVSD